MEINTRAWTSPVRMRMTIENYSKTLMSITALNGIIALSSEMWFLAVINTIFFISGLVTIISKIKFDRNPPEDE